jgi:hypothetical protein
MRVHLAGVSFLDIARKGDMPALVSFLGEVEGNESMLAEYHRPLIVDSWAHSWTKFAVGEMVGGGGLANLPEINEYHEKYMRHIEAQVIPKATYVELDVYGMLGMKKLDAAFKRVHGRCANYIRVYHPSLDRGTCDTVRRWIDDGATYVGIAPDGVGALEKLFSITRDKVRVHGFALTRFNMMTRFPFFSVDSTTHISGGRFMSKIAAVGHETRKDMLKRRDPYLAMTVRQRNMHGVIVMKNIMQEVTQLWESRGIQWPM